MKARACANTLTKDSMVVITEKGKVLYSGPEKDSPGKTSDWVFKATQKDGKGHYEWGKWKKYVVD